MISTAPRTLVFIYLLAQRTSPWSWLLLGPLPALQILTAPMRGPRPSQMAATPLRSAALASLLTSFSAPRSPSTGSPGPPGEAVEGGGLRDDPGRASWCQLSRMVVCGPRHPRPHSPIGLPASQVGFHGKPFAAACPEDLGLWSAVTSARASNFHPGPLPSALASWQEAGYGFLMFPLQTRPGRACMWTRVRPGAGSILPPVRRQGRVVSARGLQVPRAEVAGPLTLPRKLALTGIHLRAGNR